MKESLSPLAKEEMYEAKSRTQKIRGYPEGYFDENDFKIGYS